MQGAISKCAAQSADILAQKDSAVPAADVLSRFLIALGLLSVDSFDVAKTVKHLDF